MARMGEWCTRRPFRPYVRLLRDVVFPECADRTSTLIERSAACPGSEPARPACLSCRVVATCSDLTAWFPCPSTRRTDSGLGADRAGHRLKLVGTESRVAHFEGRSLWYRVARVR